MIIDQSNNLNAFDNLADKYEKFRPTYPNICFEILKLYMGNDIVSTPEKPIILDVGCGTGIATRKICEFFGDNGTIIGLEPNEDMLGRAKEYQDSNCNGINFLGGRAEDLPFDKESVKCVITAQAIQWFQRDKFYKEAFRVLCPDGVLAILQNNRNWKGSLFLTEYEELLEKYNSNYSRKYRDIKFIDELQETKLFTDCLSTKYTWSTKLNFDELIGMSSSSTKVHKIITEYGMERYTEILGELHNKYRDNQGLIEIIYETELFLYRKKVF